MKSRLLHSREAHFVLLRYASSSFISSVIDFSLFFLTYHISKSILLAVIIGRVISGVVNFHLNKYFAFKNSNGVTITGLKYLAWASCLGSVSYLLIRIINVLTHNIFISKFTAEAVLYALNFSFQHLYIFNNKAKSI